MDPNVDKVKAMGFTTDGVKELFGPDVYAVGGWRCENQTVSVMMCGRPLKEGSDAMLVMRRELDAGFVGR
jgi:hypothetical protein